MFENETTEELEVRRDEVLKTLAQIKTQLAFAKSEVAETGDYSRSQWFHNATHAMRMQGREHQMIQEELGKRRREEKRAQHLSESLERNRRFRESAKKILSPEQYMAIAMHAAE